MTFDPETRSKSIWSTEAAAACGLSERTTPAQLWAQKRGLVETEEMPIMPLPARLGLACQDGVAKLHVEDTGATLMPLHDLALQAEVSGVPVGSHFDFWNKTARRLHEVKFFALSRMSEFGEPGSDTVPMDVLLQALHEMVLWNHTSTGYGQAEACEVNVVFGNVHRAVFVVPYDLAAVDKLLQEEAKFWALVQLETSPPPQSTEDARRIWARADGKEVIADQVTVRAHQALIGVRHQIKSLEAQEEAMELHIQTQMREASVLKSPDGKVLATWNGVETERVDVKRFKAEMPDVAKVFMKTTPSRRFLPKG